MSRWRCCTVGSRTSRSFASRGTQITVSEDVAVSRRMLHVLVMRGPRVKGTLGQTHRDTYMRANSHPGPTGVEDPRTQGFPSTLDKDIMKLAVPSFATLMIEPLLGMVDTAMVGHLGGEQLAALGLGIMLNTVFTAMFTFLSTLTVPRIARFLVQDQMDAAQEHTAQALWVALLVGGVTMLLLLTHSSTLLQWSGVEPGLQAATTEYLSGRCLGNPFVLANFVFLGTLQASKDARTPLFAILVANVVKLLLNLLFIFGLGMGVRGAALATTLSYAVSCYINYSAVKYRGFLSVRQFKQGPKWGVLRPFLAEGAAISFRMLCYMGLLVTVNILIARVSTAAQAANIILRQMTIVFFKLAECVSIPTQAMAAGALAAQDTVYAQTILRRTLLAGVSVIALLSAVLCAAVVPLLGLFTSDASVVASALSAAPFVILTCPIEGVTIIIEAALTAAGQAAWTAHVTTVTSLAVLAAILAYSSVVPMTLLSVWVFVRSATWLRLPFTLHRVFLSRHGLFAQAPPRDDTALRKTAASVGNA